MNSMITTREWESKSALISHLESRGPRVVLLADRSETPRKFYSVSFAFEQGSLEIGVLSSGLGPKPGVTLLEGRKRVVIGHDAWLSGLETSGGELIFSRRLNGVFFEFLPLDTDHQVIVVHELGVAMLDADGREVWVVDTDVIKDFALDRSGNLVLTVMDQKDNIVIDIKSGRWESCLASGREVRH
jgi:hypothetical protein